MTINVQYLNDNSGLIAVTGRLDHEQSLTLEAVITDLFATDRVQFIVDFSKTTFINSSGLRTLVSGWRQARQKEGDLILCGLNENLQSVFQMVGFHKLFQIETNCDEALKRFE